MDEYQYWLLLEDFRFQNRKSGLVLSVVTALYLRDKCVSACP